jgi:hypothetical protein
LLRKQGPNSGLQYSSSINYNRSFSSSLVLSVTYGWARSKALTEGVGQDFKDVDRVTTLGLPQYILSSGYRATPNITFGNGYQSVSGQNLGSQTFSIILSTRHPHARVTFNKIRGQHEQLSNAEDSQTGPAVVPEDC